MAEQYPDVTLRDYVRVIFRQKLIILVTVLAVSLTLYVGLVFRTPVYEAQVKMLISASKQIESPFYNNISGYRQTELSRTQSEIVKSNPVLEETVRALGLYQRPFNYEYAFASPLKRNLITRQAEALEEKLSKMSPAQQQAWRFRRAVQELKQNISVEPLRDTDVFVIRVRELSPIGAAITANTLSRAYVIFDLEQQLAEMQQKYGDKHQSVRQIKDNIARMVESLTGKPLPAIDAIGPASVKIIEQASLSLEPIGQSRRRLFILGVLSSVFLGIIMAFLFDFLDQTVKTPQDIKKILNFSHLGSIPKKHWWNRAVIKPSNMPHAAYPKAVTALADQLYMLMKERSLKSVLLTSAVRSEGASTTLANLARQLSRGSARRVLMIDANMRDAELHKLFKITRSPGLADVLEGRAEFSEATRLVEGSLMAIPAGETQQNPMALLDSPRMQELMQQAGQEFDFVLVDGANLKEFRDSAILSTHVDGVALVVRESFARRQVIQTALSNLAQAKPKVLGTILTNRTFAIPKIIYDWV